jgi:ABC-type polysaccharide/polyol phosphate transport system ATPase subunit
MVRILADEIRVLYPILGAYSPDSKPAPARTGTKSWGRILPGKPPKVVALEGVSLDIGPGSRIGIVGRNGSGKTTLLRTLGGIITPDSGQLDITGETSGIFNLKQGMKLEASGYRNIILRGLALGKRPAEIKEKLETIRAFCGLDEFLDLPVHSYSSGMIMRLSFAVAVAFDPDIMLLDEWIGTADAGFSKRAMARLQEMAEKDRIFMLASHNMKLLQETCDEAILMDQGRIIEHGSTELIHKEFVKLLKASA